MVVSWCEYIAIVWVCPFSFVSDSPWLDMARYEHAVVRNHSEWAVVDSAVHDFKTTISHIFSLRHLIIELFYLILQGISERAQAKTRISITTRITMKYIIVPDRKEPKQLPFYFAVEEHVATKYTDDDYFFAWQVEPTVMLGRNQLIDNEVNVEYCRDNGVHIFRRKSGGGCVYADDGCIQFSHISFAESVNVAFGEYMKRVAELLQGIGIDAQLSGRNDILVGGRKVAGSAFYRLRKRSVLHNTVLFDTRLEHLSKALTPSHEKLQSKGVQSVSQRVENIGSHTNMSIAEFMAYARRYMCGTEELVLTEDDMGEIARIEKELASDNFVYGKNPKFTEMRKKRFADIGTLEARIELKNNVITDMNFAGDFFLTGDLDRELIDVLHGVPFTREAVEARLNGTDLSAIICGLTLPRLLRLLFGRPPHVSKPDWLKIDLTSTHDYGETASVIAKHHLNTICTSGLCPNRTECWAARTATLMIGGNVCTRKCKFCNTQTGKPGRLDPDEPKNVAESVKALGLRYAVITSVDRDDLDDYGAAHWVETIRCIKKENPDTILEVLIPDFMGERDLISMVMAERPNVAGHNMETVRRLTPGVRSVAQYERSLDVLAAITESGVMAKTGFMVGLGETEEEVEQLMDDILATGCRRLTIGQYLQPTSKHLPVAEYVTPEQFAKYKQTALKKGFKFVESGPLVRSSYHAGRAFATK